MSRVTCTPKRLARKRRLMKVAKGYFGSRSKQYKVMKETVHRGWVYAFQHRRRRKRDFRRLWILRINAASRARGVPYSRLIAGLNAAGIEHNEQYGFGAIDASRWPSWPSTTPPPSTRWWTRLARRTPERTQRGGHGPRASTAAPRRAHRPGSGCVSSSRADCTGAVFRRSIPRR